MFIYINKIAIPFFLIWTLFLEAANPFYERILQAKKGDYIVTEQENTCSLLRIYEKKETSLILEEISFQSNVKPKSYEKWLQDRAPGHLSWILYEIDLKTLKIIEAFSFSKQSWIKIREKENPLPLLLTLPCKKISLQDRRKIGPPPLPGEVDTRKAWSPPLIRKGIRVNTPSFLVYRIQWPCDSSPLSGKTLELYFEEKSSFAFPFWISAKGDHLSGFLKGIDSGDNLDSPHSFLPKRAPFFLEKKQKNVSEIVYLIQIPEYCLPFSLVYLGEKETLLLVEKKHFTLSVKNKEEETYFLHIFPERLPETRFSLRIIPEKYPELSIQKQETISRKNL